MDKGHSVRAREPPRRGGQESRCQGEKSIVVRGPTDPERVYENEETWWWCREKGILKTENPTSLPVLTRALWRADVSPRRVGGVACSQSVTERPRFPLSSVVAFSDCSPRPPVLASPSCSAAYHQMEKYVLQGGDVNKQNKLGDTPLHEVGGAAAYVYGGVAGGQHFSKYAGNNEEVAREICCRNLVTSVCDTNQSATPKNKMCGRFPAFSTTRGAVLRSRLLEWRGIGRSSGTWGMTLNQEREVGARWRAKPTPRLVFFQFFGQRSAMMAWRAHNTAQRWYQKFSLVSRFLATIPPPPGLVRVISPIVANLMYLCENIYPESLAKMMRTRCVYMHACRPVHTFATTATRARWSGGRPWERTGGRSERSSHAGSLERAARSR